MIGGQFPGGAGGLISCDESNRDAWILFKACELFANIFQHIAFVTSDGVDTAIEINVIV